MNIYKNTHDAIIEGKVCSYDDKPIPYAVIIVQKYNYSNGKYEDMGYTICTREGEFFLVIEDKESYYKLIAYESQLNCLDFEKIDVSEE